MKKKISKSLGKLKTKVTTADKAYFTPDKSLYTANIDEALEVKADKLDKQLNKEELVDFENRELGERLNTFCNQHRTNPDDLFSFLMDNYGKKPKASKEPKNDQKRGTQDLKDG